jgi:hypothetical protein
MSAFLVSNEHLNMIITWAIDNGGRDMSPQDWFKEFYLENIKSLQCRYPETYERIVYWNLDNHRYTPNFDAIRPRGLKVETAIAIVKLINCWEYQSCEHKYDQQSVPWVAMDRIKYLAYDKMDCPTQETRERFFKGNKVYDLAPWEYSKEDWKVFKGKLYKLPRSERLHYGSSLQWI